MLKSGQLKNLPRTPGVYLFKHAREILYIGKATSLRDRVSSYLKSDVLASRGERIISMMAQATSIDYLETDSALEALILEAALIKKHQPKYNAREKDDSSFWFVVVTREDYPRILLVRGKDLFKYQTNAQFGPFPYSGEIRAAMKIIRKIFPFRDKCQPNSGKACFNYQIGLCLGICVSKISKQDYRKVIRHVKLLFAGRKTQLLRDLNREMKQLAKAQKFELANQTKKQIFALKHIQDVALIKSESANLDLAKNKFRLEAYDVAHLGGQNSVGVMAVWQNGELAPDQYRKFKLRNTPAGDDLAGLREILERRLNHPEWPMPDLLVIDGGKTQLNTAKKVLLENGLIGKVGLVSVVKDETHRAREILGDKSLANQHEVEIIEANHAAHRFAISYHREKRRKAWV